jgi:predicted peroxiredoxin
VSETGGERWIALLVRGDADGIYEAAAMAASATSLGVSVTLVWLGAALEALLSERLDEPGDRPASASELLRAAKETGRLRSVACSAAAVARPRAIDDVRARVDEIVGWPTVVALMRGSDKALVW